MVTVATSCGWESDYEIYQLLGLILTVTLTIMIYMFGFMVYIDEYINKRNTERGFFGILLWPLANIIAKMK